MTWRRGAGSAMGILEYLLTNRHEDADLGVLVRGWGCWRGLIRLDDGPAVPLVLAGWTSTPDPVRLCLARELVERYAALRPVIGRALFEHYAPYAAAVDAGDEPARDDLARLAGPGDVWPSVSAVRVLIERQGGAETVEIAYRVAWDDEHTLGARFKAWSLVELNGSVRA